MVIHSASLFMKLLSKNTSIYLDCRDQERVDAPMGKDSFNHRAGPVTDSKAKLAKYLL